jgi:hypothetical protein
MRKQGLERQEVKLLGEIRDLGNQQLDAARLSLQALERIIELLTPPPPPHVPAHMHLQFEGSNPDMPGKETDVQTIPCSAIETDADGNPVTLNPANVTWAIDKLPDGSDIATLTQNADGSASFKAVKVGGPVNISCTDNSVTPPLVGTNTLEVVASTKTATSMALVFGDPQASTT